MNKRYLAILIIAALLQPINLDASEKAEGSAQGVDLGEKADVAIQAPTMPPGPLKQCRKLIPEDGKILTGAYLETYTMGPVTGKDYARKIKKFNRRTGKKLGFVQILLPLISEPGSINPIEYPADEVKHIHAQGANPLIVMLLISDWASVGKTDPLFNLEAILSGRFDNQFRRFAEDTRKTGIPAYFAVAEEWTAEWPWHAAFNGGLETRNYGDPKDYDGPERVRDVQRKIIKMFREAGAPFKYVYWTSLLGYREYIDPTLLANPLYQDRYLYPGHEYIDVIMLTLVGHLEVAGWVIPTELGVLLEQAEDQVLSQIDPGREKKVIVETAFSHIPGTLEMANWIESAYLTVTHWANMGVNHHTILGIEYWNQGRLPGWEFDNSWIDVTPQSLRAYRRAVASDVFYNGAPMGECSGDPSITDSDKGGADLAG